MLVVKIKDHTVREVSKAATARRLWHGMDGRRRESYACWKEKSRCSRWVEYDD